MKILIFIVLSIGLISCGDSLDKSILEPLTIEELKIFINGDKLLEETYELIQTARDSILKSEIETAKWADLTYKQIQDFVKVYLDSSYFNPIRERLKGEWTKEYGHYQNKADSISNQWKKYKQANSIEQYIDIEIVDIVKEYHYSQLLKSVKLGFKITPLQGQIDQIQFSYEIQPKQRHSIYLMPPNRWILSTVFQNPTIEYCELSQYYRETHEKMNLERLFRDYNIYIEIEHIRKNGVQMDDKDLNIPPVIRRYWRDDNDVIVKDIMDQILNINYLTENEYVSNEIEKILKEIDPVCYKFLNQYGY